LRNRCVLFFENCRATFVRHRGLIEGRLVGEGGAKDGPLSVGEADGLVVRSIGLVPLRWFGLGL
jgi:hypothetical protein